MRCGASNRCRYCAWLTALENALVVKLDAEAGDCPRVGFTLTTKRATTSGAAFRRDVEVTFRSIRRRWSGAEYLGLIEFTTGTGKNAGGARRIHQHGLLRGVPVEAVEELGWLLKRVWAPRTGAHRVEAHELRTVGGTIAYTCNHHHKQSQTPPRNWSGKRFRASRGYFGAPVADLREHARAHLASKRTRHAVEAMLDAEHAWETLGGDGYYEAVDAIVTQRLAAPAPPLVRVGRLPAAFGADGLPSAWETVVWPLSEAA